MCASRSRVVGLRLAVLVLLALFARAHAALVVIRFQYQGGAEESPAVEQVVRAFNASHPGIHIQSELLPTGGNANQKLLIQVAGRVAPDVVWVDQNGVIPLVDKNVLLPLNPLFARTPDFHLKDYYPVLIHRFTQNGNLYVLPRDTGPMCVLYYNKTLFDEARLPYPTKDLSFSFDPDRVQKTGMDPNKDLLTLAKKLTKYRPDGRVYVWGWDSGWENYAYSLGARMADNIDHPTHVNYDDPRIISAIQFRGDLINKYRVSPTGINFSAEGLTSMELFQQGRIAMRVSGIWDSAKLRTIPGLRWDVTTFPAGPTGIKGWDGGCSGYAVVKGCQHPEAAWEFVRYIGGAPGQHVFAAAGRAQPSLIALSHSKAWLDGLAPLGKAAIVDDAPRYSVFRPFITVWDTCSNDIQQEIGDVNLGRQTAAEAVAKSLPIAQKHMDEYRFQPKFPPLDWRVVIGAIALFLSGLIGFIFWKAKRELGPHATRAQRRETRAGYLAILPWIIGFCAFTVGPLVISLVMAFCRWDVIGDAQWAGGWNFRQIVSNDPLVPIALKNTLVYTVAAVPIGIAASLLLAMLLNTGVKGMRTFRTLFYLPAVTSGVAVAVLWKWLFNPDLGLLNLALDRLHLVWIFRLLGLVNEKTHSIMWIADERLAKPSLVLMSLWGAGGGMIIYLAGLQGIPRSLYEAADMDGAGALSKFRNVTLPMLTPTIFFSLIMGVIGSFQVFTPALVMTENGAGGPKNALMFYVLYLYRTAFLDLRMGYASALAWILFGIILVVTLIQFRASKWVYYEGGTTR